MRLNESLFRNLLNANTKAHGFLSANDSAIAFAIKTRDELRRIKNNQILSVSSIVTDEIKKPTDKVLYDKLSDTEKKNFWKFVTNIDAM